MLSLATEAFLRLLKGLFFEKFIYCTNATTDIL